MTWFVRYRVMLSIVTFLASFFVAFWAAELLDGHVPWTRGSIGFFAAGLCMSGFDLAGRALSARSHGPWRFVHHGLGLSVRGIPVWTMGLLFIALSSYLTSH